MFEKISEPVDQAGFFKFASKLAHIDGDFGEEEQEVMLRLKRKHLLDVDISELVGKVNLSFEDPDAPREDNDFKEAVYSYREKFLEKLMGKKQ